MQKNRVLTLFLVDSESRAFLAKYTLGTSGTVHSTPEEFETEVSLLPTQNRMISGAESETRYTSEEHDHDRKREVKEIFGLALRARGRAPPSSVSLSAAVVIHLFCRLDRTQQLFSVHTTPEEFEKATIAGHDL